jgi:dipeptidyl aminopeptidase/acylaminoacyl peptidase
MKTIGALENSLMFAEALRLHGVRFDLHVYQTGGHGLGLNTKHARGEACTAWLRQFAG